MNQNKLKIINSNENDIKRFKSVDEFNLFYHTNKEMMDTKTTQWLNKNYSIITDNGDIYRITKLNTRDNEGKRQQGQICLKKVKKELCSQAQSAINEKMTDNINEKMSDNSNELINEKMIDDKEHQRCSQALSAINEKINEKINEIDSRNQELQHKIKSKLKLYDEKMKHFDIIINELSSKINKMDNVLTQVVNIINGT